MARLVAERGDVVPLLGEVFRRYGFEGASIARITAGTSLGKGSLHHFFSGGQDEMAEAVLGHIRDWFEAEVFAPLEQDPPREAIGQMLVSVDRYFRSGRRICLVGAFALEDTRDRFAAAVRGYFGRWLAVLSGALVRAGLEVAEADSLARAAVAGIQGALILSRALDDTAPFTALLDGHRRVLLQALPEKPS
ncbi:TetR/AcrR family transcriptional regulator [Segnochrobactraceae bacterium EtOH-i3]